MMTIFKNNPPSSTCLERPFTNMKNLSYRRTKDQRIYSVIYRSIVFLNRFRTDFKKFMLTL